MVATLAGPAEPVLASASARSKRDRRLLADPLGVAPDVAVEDQVADDEQSRLPQRLDPPDEVESHATRPSLADDRPRKARIPAVSSRSADFIKVELG